MANTMITKLTIWTFNEREGKWYGICRECKGEKAKYTPQILKDKGIKPCEMCTNMELYNSARPNIVKES
jgi:hypothetical protein